LTLRSEGRENPAEFFFKSIGCRILSTQQCHPHM